MRHRGVPPAYDVCLQAQLCAERELGPCVMRIAPVHMLCRVWPMRAWTFLAVSKGEKPGARTCVFVVAVPMDDGSFSVAPFQVQHGADSGLGPFVVWADASGREIRLCRGDTRLCRVVGKDKRGTVTYCVPLFELGGLGRNPEWKASGDGSDPGRDYRASRDMLNFVSRPPARMKRAPMLPKKEKPPKPLKNFD